MSSEQTRDVLEETDVFGSCSETVLDETVSCARPESYEPDELVYETGDQPDDVFVVSEGAVRISRPVADEHDASYIARRGDTFGLMSAVTGEGRQAQARVVSDENGVCFRVDVRTVIDRLKDRGAELRCFYDRILAHASDRLSRASRIIDTLL